MVKSRYIFVPKLLVDPLSLLKIFGKTLASFKKASVYKAFKTYSGFEGVPSSQAGPDEVFKPPVAYFLNLNFSDKAPAVLKSVTT